MGKSDNLIFPEYHKALQGIGQPLSVAFLGNKEENQFTSTIISKNSHFYDLQLDNWNINSNWHLKQKYDLIVCTRCAYFSKEPNLFIQKCKMHLNPGGYALIDWGLGDHWRFENYKVGWVRNGEHEYAYKKDNFLYSCYWKNNLAKEKNVIDFWKNVVSNRRFGYSSEDILQSVIEKEVPHIVNYDVEKISCLFLWPDNPQLYITTLIKNEQ